MLVTLSGITTSLSSVMKFVVSAVLSGRILYSISPSTTSSTPVSEHLRYFSAHRYRRLSRYQKICLHRTKQNLYPILHHLRLMYPYLMPRASRKMCPYLMLQAYRKMYLYRIQPEFQMMYRPRILCKHLFRSLYRVYKND